MSDKPTICVACDCIDDQYFQTPAGAGPFCGDCWESLNDPDQSLLLEKRVANYELEVKGLRSLVRAADALQLAVNCSEYVCGPFVDTRALIQELREEARCDG